MKARLATGVAVLALAAGALALRLPRLGERPMHADEAVLAVKSGILLETGAYRFEADEYHGPLLHLCAWPAMRLQAGRDFAATDETCLRAVPALFGAGLVLLHLLLRPGLGWLTAGTAALGVALSPAMVFYSRYYIPETLLVFFTLATILAGANFARTGRPAWAIAVGLCAGLMVAAKETASLAFLAMAAGAVALEPRRVLPLKWVALAGATALLTIFLLYSTFLTHLRGPFDLLQAYVVWARRGADGGLHDHPWHFYLQTLLYVKHPYGPVWTEAAILVLALAGLVAALWGKCAAPEHVPLARFFAVYTVALTAVYALIPYKTPWCLLGSLQGMCVLAGIGFAAIVQALRPLALRLLAAVLLLAALGHLGWQAYRASFQFAADRRNPYVYAHATRDAARLGEVVRRVAALAPEGNDLLVQVITPDYWPLPWYFRTLRRVGYWDRIPEQVQGGVIVTAPELSEQVKARLPRAYREMYYGLRPTVVLAVYIRDDLWAAYQQRHAQGPPVE